MSYTVLARRYRSRDFTEVVGQEPIARTLQNAIAANRTAHAYLFCGTRGVGKTSMARIFARALNVTDDLQDREAIVDAILRGDDLDVIEIDAASNRGVNEARDLIAGAGLSPSRGRYKIYIIDEVHMLTREAFNTLLKTMEEPPSHVKFILCTTEPHKVPPTIQSRCQRFDFRAISTTQIAEHLRQILKEEGVEATDDAVLYVARLGNGSMRDALSVLDRLLAAGADQLTSELLEDMLGLPDRSIVSRLVDAIAAADTAQGLRVAGELLSRGVSIEQALEMLADHLRSVMVAKACGSSSEMLELTAEVREEASRQAEAFDLPALVHMIAMCDATSRNARYSAAARALFDALIARLCLNDQFASIQSMIESPGSASASTGIEPKKKGEPLNPPLTHEVKRPLSSTPPAPQMTELKPATESPLDAGSLWSRALDQAGPALRAKMGLLQVEGLEHGVLRLSISEEGLSQARYLRTQSEQLAAVLKQVSGQSIRVQITAPERDGPTNDPAQAAEIESVQRDPLVRAAMELFDGTIISVEQAPDDAGQTDGAN